MPSTTMSLREKLPMNEMLKVSAPGLVIPAKWLRDMGKEVTVQREGAVLLIESSARTAARMGLKDTVSKLRRAAKTGGPSAAQVAAEVAAVRAQHARRR